MIKELGESLVNKIIHGSIKTHCNLCSGQGVFLAAFITQLDKSDVIFDSHRSHGHYIAKGDDNKRPCWRSTDVKTVRVVAKGGAMHLNDSPAELLNPLPAVAETLNLVAVATLSFDTRKKTFQLFRYWQRRLLGRRHIRQIQSR